ncbi:MAG: hypothetical protein KDA42_14760, partial [Planctomycetales bacterium]|nr:hypothetical protein [Planctomycetales bacterium]
YHLFAGRPPFDGDNTGQVLANKIKGKVRDLSTIADGISHASLKLVQEMMAADPEDRPQSYVDLIARIDGLENVTREVINVPRKQVAVARKKIAEAETLCDEPRKKTDKLPTREATEPQRARRSGWLGRLVAFVFFVSVCGGVLYLVKDEDQFKEFAESWLPYEFFGQGYTNDFQGPVLVQGGTTASLFNGASLDGWSKPRGDWKIAKDSQGDVVLAGHSGVISRPLPALHGDGAEAENYNLRMRVDVRDALAVEVHFSVVIGQGQQDERYVLRMTQRDVVLGRQDWNSKAFLPVTEPLPFPARKGNLDVAEYHELRIGRHQTHWLAYFDGHMLGTLPVTIVEPIRSIGLVTEEGTAYFKDLRMSELISPREPVGKPPGFTGSANDR